MTQTKFAKLYETELYGQILVTIGRNDATDPCVRYTFQAVDGTQVEVAPGFTDDDEGWDRAQRLFDESDLAKTLSIVQPQYDAFTKMLQEEE